MSDDVPELLGGRPVVEVVDQGSLFTPEPEPGPLTPCCGVPGEVDQVYPGHAAPLVRCGCGRVFQWVRAKGSR